MLADIPHVIPSLVASGGQRGKPRPLARALGVLYGLVLLEVFLRIFSPFPMVTGPTAIREHGELGYVMDSRYPDIDPDGFRNGSAGMARADIATLGDSMTYGYNVRYAENWPSQLGDMTGRSVYNYGIGGYGPLQYLNLFKRAIREKQAKVVVLGLNPAYELNDFCGLLLDNAYWKAWMADRSVDAARCASFQKGGGASDNVVAPENGEGESLAGRVKALIKATAIGDAIRQDIVTPYRDWRDRDPGATGVLFKDGRNNTIISERYNAYTLSTTDLSRPDKQLGLELTQSIIAEMAAEARANGVTLIIALMPSRQSVVRAYLEHRGVALSSDFLECIRREAQIIDIVGETARAAGVTVVDPRMELVKLMESRRDVYPFRDDGHPLAVGYGVIARSVADLVVTDRRD